MSSPLNTVLNNLSDGLVVLVEAVALFSRPSHGVASWWMEASRIVQALYTDLRIYKALFELRFSDSALVDRDISPLKHFSEALSACNDAVRSTVAQLSMEHSSGAHNAPETSFSPLCGGREGGLGLTVALIEQRTELGHSFALMWFHALPKSLLAHAVATPLPPSPLNDADLSTIQSDTSPLPHSKPLRGFFQPPPLSMDAQSLETSLSAALTTAGEMGKQWRMGIQVDETNQLLPLLPLVLGSIFCVILEDEPSSPISFAPSIVSLRSLICNTLLGMSDNITSIALLGTAGSGKSLLVNSLVGSRLLVPGKPTVLPCRIQHVPGLSTPKLNIVSEPFTFAVDELRRLRFTARCTEWDADRTTRTLGRSDADASFKELWQIWLTLDSGIRPVMETIDQSGLEFHPVTTGCGAVRETLLNLESVIRLCQAFNILIPFDSLEWPVLQIEFKPFKDTALAHSWEILNLPGIHFATTADDLFLLDRLVQRGSTIVPVLNMAEQLSDPKWSRLPKKLNELHIPVPYVIGPFLGVTKHDDPDGRDFAKLVAAKMWPTARDPKVENPQRDNLVDRVLPCALVEGFSAKYLLDALSSESAQGKPSLHTAWADKSDISFWCLRHMFELKNEEKYNALSIMDLDRYLRIFLSDSKLDAVIGAIAQVASESPAEKGAKQLKYFKEQLHKFGQELDQLLIKPPSLPSTPPEFSAGGPSSTVVEKIIHGRMNDLRARTKNAVDTALRDALGEMKKKWPPEKSKHPTTPTYLEDSAEYMIPISALGPFLELSTSHLQTTLPKLGDAWLEEVNAAIPPTHRTIVNSLDLASIANDTSSPATRLQGISVNSREFTTLKPHRSRESDERAGLDSAHNPLAAISRLVRAFLRRVHWLIWPRPAGYRIPNEHATLVYMRVLGEPWLSDLERVALASAREEVVHGGTGRSEKGLFGAFAIRYSIAVTLAALE